jgi:hypothetical protein
VEINAGLDQYFLFASLGPLADIAAGRGQAERAARLFAARHALRRKILAWDEPARMRLHHQHQDAVRAVLGEAAYAAAWADGLAMSPEEAEAYALQS